AEAANEGGAARPSSAAITNAPVVMGSAAPAVAPAPQTDAGVEEVRLAVLEALGSAGQAMLCSMLETGEWKVEGNDLIVRVSASAALIEMSVGAEARRTILAAAASALGRSLKLQVMPGTVAQTAPPTSTPGYSNGSSRGRAEQEPVVRRMKEKFGAEIRTVIDYRQNR
ncbi:MAG TPA: hypothetical protein VFB00_02170, partial [Terriglobales bacterium]|nr:hypothetical protein [Terriglobales bacterium]